MISPTTLYLLVLCSAALALAERLAGSGVHQSDLLNKLVESPATSSSDKYARAANSTCYLSPALTAEIQSYRNISQLILNVLTSGAFKGTTYKELQTFVDRYANRLTGSDELEEAIDFLMERMRNLNLNVSAEDVEVPHWVRGAETADMISPWRRKIALLGFGYTIGTPPDGITAEVLVVKTFDELRANASQAQGKIIVYNQDYDSYGVTNQYRGYGAREAAKVGGVAALTRSVTPFSLYTLHTGAMAYEANVTQIPAAAITVEDAEFLYRLQQAGHRVVLRINMNDTNLPPRISRNVIVDLQGSEKPDEYIVVSGHIDNWDVGQGAMDDAGGVIISTNTLALFQFLNLRPRRTLRAIAWTAEEFFVIGAERYLRDHEGELDKFKAMFEADLGVFKPLGLDFAGTDEAACIVKEILQLLSPINATEFTKEDIVGSDTSLFIPYGVPNLSLKNSNEQYFFYHHSQADTMTVLTSDDLDLCVALWATVSYVLADLSVELPRSTTFRVNET